MISLDQDRFFADFPSRTGLPLGPRRKQGLAFLLGKLSRDPGFTMVREMAYVLATIRWETGDRFLPIRELRASRTRSPGVWKLQSKYWGSGFFGRGYVQITWEANYRKAGQKLEGGTIALDPPVSITADTFVKGPDYVLEPDVAYEICARGMREGWFTGRKLGQYIRDGEPTNYVNARRVVNRLDRAQEIADRAAQFELLLRAARI